MSDVEAKSKPEAKADTPAAVWSPEPTPPPVNGWVTNLPAQLGDYASLGTNVISLVDANSFWVDAYFEDQSRANPGRRPCRDKADGLPPGAAGCGPDGRDGRDRADRSAILAHTATRPVIVPVIVVVMGVAGSGKSTVAALLAAALGCQFQEGDALHPRDNVEKMRSGIPLTDGDRLPWLRKIAEEIDGWRARGEGGVLTCSALKRSYRDIIIGGRHDVALVYLKGSRELIRLRMAARHEHFMPIALLDSQFATLEEPTPDEHPIIVDVGWEPAEIVQEIVRQLEHRQGSS